MQCSSIDATSNVNNNSTTSYCILQISFLMLSFCRNANGDTLVITCEGNCGFYETGIISTPMNKGYSVLGWNHPGFGSSTVSNMQINFIYNLNNPREKNCYCFVIKLYFLLQQ